MSGSPRRAVFLDRDGTLIEDADYLTQVEQIRLLPGVAQALADLHSARFMLIVVTNQSALARGWLGEEGLAAIHAELNAQLGSAAGVKIDAFYHCPHLPHGAVPRYARACDCRKPAAGLILRAAADWHIAPDRSYMVGDSPRDVEAGSRAGCYSIRLGRDGCLHADAVVADLPRAAEHILDREAHHVG